MPRTATIVFAVLSLVLAAGCGEPTPEELLAAASEAHEEARVEVEAAREALAAEEEVLRQVQAKRDAAAERLREAERVLAAARTDVQMVATDELLFGEVQRRLLADEELGRHQVAARVDDGVVTLSGTVPTAALRNHAGEVAAGVPGIRSVTNGLTTPEPEPEPETSDDAAEPAAG